MALQLVGIPYERIKPFIGLPDSELASRGAKRVIAESAGYPCRLSLADVPVGETAILLHYEHHPAPGPYRASGPIYVWERAPRGTAVLDRFPQEMQERLYSLRAYDSPGLMLDADVVQGSELPALAERMLSDPSAAYLRAHHARRGCYAFAITRRDSGPPTD